MGATAQDVLSGRVNTGPGAFRDRVGVRNASDAIADLVTSHEVDIQRVEAGYRRKARNKLRLLEQDLDDQLKKIDPSSPQHVTFRQKRLEKLQKSTRESINNSYASTRKEFKNDLRDFSKAESRAAGSIANKAIGVNLFDVSVSPATLRAVVDGTLIEGTPLNDHWNRQSRRTRERFESQMAIGVLQGEDLGALRKRLRGTHTGKYVTVTNDKGKKKRVGVYEGGVMTTSRREADALIRTATQSVSNRVRDDMIKNNDDIAKGRQALVTLDGRTSPICIARSGHAWDLQGKPIESSGASGEFPGPPPWHVNCRTTLIPLLRSWDELRGPKSKISKKKLAALEKAGRRTQASMDGQVARRLNYEQWLRKKSKSFQDGVLGKRKAALWRDGQIKSLSSLVDQTGRPITVDEFRKRSGLPPIVKTGVTAVAARLLFKYVGLDIIKDTVAEFVLNNINYGEAESIQSVIQFAQAIYPAEDQGPIYSDFFGLSVLGVPMSQLVDLAEQAELINLATVVGASLKKAGVRKEPPPPAPRGALESITNGMATFRFDENGRPVIIQHENFIKSQRTYNSMPELNLDPAKPDPVRKGTFPGQRDSTPFFWQAYRDVRKAYLEGNITPEVQKIVDGILADSSPLSQGMVVFRGVADKRPGDTFVKNLLQTVKIGDVLPTAGPISTAMNPVYPASLTRTSVSDPDNRRVMLVLELEKGQRALLANTREQEVTIPDGYSIRVDDIYRHVEGKVYTPDSITGTVPSAPNIIKGTIIKNEERIIHTAPERGPEAVAAQIAKFKRLNEQGRLVAMPDLERSIETGLFPVQIQNGEKWCGPGVVSSLTGTDTVTTANVIRKRKGWLDDTGLIKATSFNEVKEATRELLPKGMRITDDSKPLTAIGEGDNYVPLHETNVTVADWMQNSARLDGSYGVVVWNPDKGQFHWVAISKQDGRAFATDNGVMVGTDPVPIEQVGAFNRKAKASVYAYFRTEREQVPEQLQVIEDNGHARINRDNLGRPMIEKYSDFETDFDLYENSDLFIPPDDVPSAAQEYFGTAYMSVTTQYRSGFVTADTQRIVAVLSNSSKPLPADTVVFRGLHRLGKQFLDKLKPNTLLMTRGAPFSTSADPLMAMGFAGGESSSKANAFLILNLKKGQRAVLGNAEELEYTIPEGHSIVIRKIHRREREELPWLGVSQPAVQLPEEFGADEFLTPAAVTRLGDTVIEADVVKDMSVLPLPKLGNDFTDVEYRTDGIPIFRQKPDMPFAGYSRDADNKYYSSEIYVDTSFSEPLEKYYSVREKNIEAVEWAYVSGDFRDPEISSMVKAVTDWAVPIAQPLVMFMGSGPKERADQVEVGQIVKAGTGPLNGRQQLSQAVRIEVEGGPSPSERILYVVRADRGTPVLAANPDVYGVTIPEGYALRVDRVHRDVSVPLPQRSPQDPRTLVPPTVVEATIVKVQATGPVRSRSAADEPIIFSALKDGVNKILGTEVHISGGEVTYIEFFGSSDIQRKTYRKLHQRISGPASDYFSYFYREVSDAFRINKFSPEVVEVVQSITKNSRPLPEAQTLFRGMGLPKRVADKYVIGQVLVPLGPFSTSLGVSAGVSISARRARELSREGKDGRVVLFAIDAPAGTPYVADNPAELELTIPHGYAFKIDDIFEVDPETGTTDVGGVQIYKMYAASIVPLEGIDPLQATEVEVLDFGGQSISAGDAKGNAIYNAIVDNKSFVQAAFDSSTIVETNMDGLDMSKATFVGSSLKEVWFTDGTNLDEVSFVDAKLDSVLFDGVTVELTKFTNAEMDKVLFQTGVTLDSVSFLGANITESSFLAAGIHHTNFFKAKIDNTTFETEVIGGTMELAKVTNSKFDKSNFKSLDVTGSTFDKVSFVDTTWVSSHMLSAIVLQSDFDKSVFEFSRSANSSFTEVTFRGSRFRDVAIRTNRYHVADFRDAKLLDVEIDSSLFTTSRFANARFENVTISGVSMEGADFRSASIIRTSMLPDSHGKNTTLLGSDFDGAKFFKTTLLEVDMTRVNLANTTIDESVIFSDMTSVNLSSAKIMNSKMKQTNFRYVNFENTLFKNTDLRGSKFVNADLTSTEFTGAMDLSEVVFDDAKMRGINLSRMVAGGASFKNADLRDADFSGAELIGADFTGANLTGADFTGAILDDVVWPKGYDPLQ